MAQRILVVDDEEDLCEILRFNLEAEGYEVVTTASAEEALKDSFRDAVERVVGVFVDAEAQAENDQLIHDQVLTHSNA